MKRKVIFSPFCIFMTLAGLAILIGVMFLQARMEHWIGVYVIAAAIVTLCGFAFVYSPQFISVEDGAVNVRRALATKSIPLSEIEEVRLSPPTMGARRLMGSGGWFGYWGWYREDDLGRYFAYFGRASDCFLLSLRDGSKYLLGCADAPEMVEYIRKQLQAR
ncbi:MAG: PH domain-containing protein [Muribaculaceae bacterium]|nr:PH domain-containing protein [Muribaculaceae bacterium]MDE7082062.1 PH domain-containing protein [Muribaculaceae bacterium]